MKTSFYIKEWTIVTYCQFACVGKENYTIKQNQKLQQAQKLLNLFKQIDYK